jgi:hypothetical protein
VTLGEGVAITQPKTDGVIGNGSFLPCSSRSSGATFVADVSHSRNKERR